MINPSTCYIGYYSSITFIDVVLRLSMTKNTRKDTSTKRKDKDPNSTGTSTVAGQVQWKHLKPAKLN